jgi:hypothetical protein
MTRRDELAAGLDDVRRRIGAAASAAGRDPAEVTLVVVTKFFPASDVRLLAELGVTDVGENRHPEAGDKVAECGDLGLRWHFIGGLQSNKAAVVGSYADVVESVDRVKLVHALERGAGERPSEVDVLLQVTLDPPGRGGRSGADPDDLHTLADAVEAAGPLRLRGLMAVAAPDEDPAAAFGRLTEVHARFVGARPAASWLSAGMSNDFEAAIAAGATHVRVGSAILGARPTFK